MLQGITVLDLSTVGPAARAGRWLADYGADVVKVGAPAKAGAVQIEPVFYAYSAHRRRPVRSRSSPSSTPTPPTGACAGSGST